MQWATTDPTLWNPTFAGNINAGRCRHYFSLYHSHDSYNKAPELATLSFMHQPPSQPLLTSTQSCHICLTWIYNCWGIYSRNVHICLYPLTAHSLAANTHISVVFVQNTNCYQYSPQSNLLYTLEQPQILSKSPDGQATFSSFTKLTIPNQ